MGPHAHVALKALHGPAASLDGFNSYMLSHLLNQAIEWGWMDRRPAKINRFSEGQGRITYLTVDQITRLVECAKADSNAQIYPFIVIGLETAMR